MELTDRVRQLEARVDTLTEALRVLARGLENGPLAEPGDHRVPDAARQAYELLLAAGTPPAAGRADS